MARNDVFSEIKAAVKGRNTEAAQRNAVAKILGKYGYFRTPEIAQTRAEDGVTVRIYTFHNTPAGSFALVAGPSLEGEVHLLSELTAAKAPPGLYIAAAPVPQKVAKVEERAITDQMRRSAAAEMESRRVLGEVEGRYSASREREGRQKAARDRLVSSGRMKVFETPKGQAWSGERKRNPAMDWEAEEAALDAGYEYVGLEKSKAPKESKRQREAREEAERFRATTEAAQAWYERGNASPGYSWTDPEGHGHHVDIAIGALPSSKIQDFLGHAYRMEDAAKKRGDVWSQAAWRSMGAGAGDILDARADKLNREHNAAIDLVTFAHEVYKANNPTQVLNTTERLIREIGDAGTYHDVLRMLNEFAPNIEAYAEVTGREPTWTQDAYAIARQVVLDLANEGELSQRTRSSLGLPGVLPTADPQDHRERMSKADADMVRAAKDGFYAGVPGYGPVVEVEGDIYRAARQTKGIRGGNDTWGVQIFRRAQGTWQWDSHLGTMQFAPETPLSTIYRRLLRVDVPVETPRTVDSQDPQNERMSKADAEREGREAFGRGRVEDDYPDEVVGNGLEKVFRKGWDQAYAQWSDALKTLVKAVPAWKDWDPSPIEDLRDYDRMFDDMCEHLASVRPDEALRLLNQFTLNDAHTKKLIAAGERVIRNVSGDETISFRNLIDRLVDKFGEEAAEAEQQAVRSYAEAVNETLQAIRHKAEVGGVRADEAREALDIIEDIGMSGLIDEGLPGFEVYDFSDNTDKDTVELEKEALKAGYLLPYERELDYIRGLLGGEYAYKAPTKTPSMFQAPAEPEPAPDEDAAMLAQFEALLRKALG